MRKKACKGTGFFSIVQIFAQNIFVSQWLIRVLFSTVGVVTQTLFSLFHPQ